MHKKIELRHTGETITFIKTATETKGERVETIVTLPAGSEGPPMHRHVFQSEYFEVIEGNLGLKCGADKIEIGPGENFIIPKNTFHSFYSADGREVKFKASFTPAMNIEYLLTEIFESCNRKNSKVPSPFDACYILQQARGEYHLQEVPLLVQKTIFPMTAYIGKFLGFVKAKPKLKV